MKRPIGPTAHGAIDYVFVATQLAAPTLFGLKGTARTLCYAFAAMQGVLNVFTKHPLALKPLVPLRIHGQLETPFVPSLVLLPLALGAMRQPNARRYFTAFFLVALTNYILTDYDAPEAND